MPVCIFIRNSKRVVYLNAKNITELITSSYVVSVVTYEHITE